MSDDPLIVALKDVRLGYCDLWEAVATADTAEPKFSANFLLDPVKHKKIIRQIEAAKALLVERDFKGKEPKWKNDHAMVDGDDCIGASTGEPYPAYVGYKVVRAKSKKRPKLLDRSKSPTVEKDGLLEPGNYVDGIVKCYVQTDPKKGGPGFFAQLEVVRYLREGEPIGGGNIDVDDYLDDMPDDEDDDV